MPAAHIRSKYCFAVASLSGVNRLGDILILGPEVLMKHSTPWQDLLDANEALVISRNSLEETSERGGMHDADARDLTRRR